MLQDEFYAKLNEAKERQDSLRHHGIKGQKWGVRNYQNLDGSYTPAGRERYGMGPAREPKMVDERIGGLTELATLAGIGLGTSLLGDAIHDAKVSKDIKNWEANRQLEQTDPKTGLKIKSDINTSVKDDMKMINREYAYGTFKRSMLGIDSKKTLGHTENCMACTTALDLKRRGFDVKAGESKEGYYAKDIMKWYKEDKKPYMGRFNRVVEELEKQPEGSYGNFMVYWKEGGGHSMFYQIEDNKAVLYDAQSNKKYSLSTIAKHANMELPGHAFFRTDNLTPNYELLKKEGIIG